MTWITLYAVLSFAIGVLLFAQGLSIFSGVARFSDQALHPPHIRWFGLLTALVAVMGMIGVGLFLSGWLMLSPEFGLVMVQGAPASVGLALLLIGNCVGVGVGLHVAWAEANKAAEDAGAPARWPKGVGWLLGIGAVIGLRAVFRIVPLNPDDFEPLRVYTYDLWWPPGLIWLSLCVVETGLAILNLGSRLGRIVAATITLAVLSFWALHQPSLSDPNLRIFWSTCLFITLPASACLATWMALPVVGAGQLAASDGRRLALTFSPLVVGLASGLVFRDVLLREAAQLLFWSAWLGIAFLTMFLGSGRDVYVAQRAGSFKWAELFKWLDPLRFDTQQGIRVGAVAILGLSLANLFYRFADVEPAISIIAFILAWTVLTEIVTDGLLHQLVKDMRQGKLLENPFLQAVWKKAQEVWARLGQRVVEGVKSLTNLTSWWMAAVKALVGLAVLIALSELPNAGKTIIQPFTVIGAGVAEELGQSISDRVLNNLGLLTQELQPDVIIPSPGTQEKRSLPILTLGAAASEVDAVLAGNTDLEIGSIKIPLSLLIYPIQRPMRVLLGVRLINGSLQSDRHNYSLLASSNTGETWLARYPIPQTFNRTLVAETSAPLSFSWAALPEPLELTITESNGAVHSVKVPLAVSGSLTPTLVVQTVSTQAYTSTESLILPLTLTLPSAVSLAVGGEPMIVPLSTRGPITITLAPESTIPLTGLEENYRFPVTLQEDLSLAIPPSAEEVVNGLAEQLAFNVISTGPALAATGMTRSWEAFELFRKGLVSWQAYVSGDEDALTEAIRQFRRAAQLDSSFALADYRLGLALEKDGQPASAAAAFRASLAANPDFVPVYNALAYHLYYFNNFYYFTAAAVPPLVMERLSPSYTDEARRLWQQVLLFPAKDVPLSDRASAYYGLCQAALDRNFYRLAYFYCARAERLYDELSADLRSDPRVKQAEASVLRTLGRAVETEGLVWVQAPRGDTDWNCASETIGELSPSGEITQRLIATGPRLPAALRHYQQALALQPDDPELRCRAALSAWALGDSKPMQALAEEANARIRLAEVYSILAKQATFTVPPGTTPSPYYRLALDEYRAAVKLDPNKIVALNGYAYTFWEWQLKWPGTELPPGYKQIADEAEQYARRALRLSAGKEPPAIEATVRSTLGEVLLGEGRLADALEALQAALAVAPKHAAYDEIRWDLAQAYLCAADAEIQTDLSPANMELAAGFILNRIEAVELEREVQPFTEKDLLELKCRVVFPGTQ